MVRETIRLYLEDSPKIMELPREAVSLAGSQALGCAGSTEGATALFAEPPTEYKRVSVALAPEDEE